ncbi:MAG: VCBS repeat-containing protein [Solirubrobacteraceae bacterium]|nr:VCBS repeat-containing protein [Solirubrobacteraceae bacterium]
MQAITIVYGKPGWTPVYIGEPGANGLLVLGGGGFKGLVRSPDDFNGDGKDDIAVDGGGGGGARIILGRAATGRVEPTDNIELLDGGLSYGGTSIAGVGDLTGDGKDDLVVGSRFVAGRAAQAEVSTYYEPEIPGAYGARAYAAGDVDGDGKDDALLLNRLASQGPGEADGATLLTGGVDVLAPQWLGDPYTAGAAMIPNSFRPGANATVLILLVSEKPVTIELVLRTSAGATVGTARVPNVSKLRTPWDGKVNGQALAPGGYRSSVTAIDAAGNRSKTKTVDFTILP